SAVLEIETEIDGVNQCRRYHRLEFKRPNQPLQSDGSTAEGDQRAAPSDGSATRRHEYGKLKSDLLLAGPVAIDLARTCPRLSPEADFNDRYVYCDYHSPS